MTAISLYNMADDTFNLKLKNFVLFDREEDGGASQ